MPSTFRHFLIGMGQAFDLFGASRRSTARGRYAPTLLEAAIKDAQALEGDLYRVGDDLRAATLVEAHAQQEAQRRQAAS